MTNAMPPASWVHPARRNPSSPVFLVLRRMRAPLIVLIVIYAISVLGLMLVPGVDADGKPAPPMNLFHAFYFISYTATTIGFGELPSAFSEPQRAWVTVSIYLTVVGWSYAIVTILALVQEKAFRSAMSANRFERRVRRMTEPFTLVCGAGACGTLVANGLDRLGRRFVLIDKDELRLAELDLEDLAGNPPMLAGDARVPDTLLQAGMLHPQCEAVLALTNDDAANLGIAIAARLLNPEYPVLARTSDPRVAANMASFGTDHVIDPFERFAEELALAIERPEAYRLIETVTSLPGAPLPELHHPPRGRWVVCGYGRFGQAVVRRLEPLGCQVVVVDPQAPVGTPLTAFHTLATEESALLEAGIREANGVVAATDDDVDNLSIAMTARQLNPGVFVVSRQNDVLNTPLFEAFTADFAMVPTTIVAQDCLALLTTPMLNTFVRLVREQPQPWCADLAHRLEVLGDGVVPQIWGLRLDDARAAAVHRALGRGEPVTLEALTRNSSDRTEPLAVVPLLLLREGRSTLLPEPGTELHPGDGVLFGGTPSAQHRQALVAQNVNVLDYVIHGEERDRGWLWSRLSRPRTG